MAATRFQTILSRALLVLVLGEPVLVSGCSSTPADKRVLQYLNQQGFGKRYVGNAQEQNYVTVGDTVLYLDTKHPDEVSGSERVDIDGTITLPEVGAVYVAGYTREDLETYLTQKLSVYYAETDVQVKLASAPSSKVYYVLEGGRYAEIPFDGNTTLFEAVMRAGPSAYDANLRRVQLIRADPRDPFILTADVTEIWRVGDSTYNVQLREFDIVYIPPTIIKQFADVIAGIFSPFVSAFGSLFRLLLFYRTYDRYQTRGGAGGFGF